MKKLLCVVACLFPVLMFAQSPFDGTWKTNMSASKLSQKPYVFSVNNGMYDCDSCAPKLMGVKADGSDQAVTGQPYDTLAVKVVSPTEGQFTTKKNGKPTGESTRTVSADGKTLSLMGTTYPPDGSSYKYDQKFMRVAAGPAGSNKISGSWRVQSVNVDNPGVTMTYKVSGDEVSFSTPAGESWTAKFGGPEQAVRGVYSNETVSVKKISDRSIEVTRNRDGKLYSTNKVTISADGMKMTEMYDNKMTGRMTTYVDEKQ